MSLKRVETDKRFNTHGIPRKKTKAAKTDQGSEAVPNANVDKPVNIFLDFESVHDICLCWKNSDWG